MDLLANVFNDLLYDELENFFDGEFESEEQFYSELTTEIYRLEKKFEIRFEPNEIVFIARSARELRFR